MIQLADHFRSDERRRHSEWLRQRQWFIKAKQDQARRDKAEEKLDEDFTAFAAEVVMATDTQIAKFEARLDAYDEATVIALMENQQALEAARERIDGLLARAYVMEDGRRVFKTEDGTQVFDEFGEELSREEIDPDLIGPNHPTWEAFKAEKDLEGQLVKEQESLLDFQAKLDEARERSSDGEMSVEEMEGFDAELEALMPESVREHAGMASAGPKIGLTSAFAAPSQDGLTHQATNSAPKGGTGQEMQFTPP